MKKDLLQYRALAKFLKDALGERYRISLIDIEDLNHEWTVEDRAFVQGSEDSTMERGILSDILNSTELKKRDYLCSFSETENNSTGQKNSYFYIRDNKGEILGFLCICEKENNKVTVREVFEQLLASEEDSQPLTGTSRSIGEEVDTLMRERIEEIWNRYKTPGKRLKKADKLAFILELMDTGIFRMKGAAVQVSKVTGISQASIYRYLGEAVEE